MNSSFTTLKADEKTFRETVLYTKILKKGDNPFNLDMILQKRAIEKYLKENGYSTDEQDKIITWIKQYSKNFRSRLNSIKMISIWLSMNHEIKSGNETLPFSYEDFIHAVRLWNQKKENFVDTIFV